jgi:hypothetical protein
MSSNEPTSIQSLMIPVSLGELVDRISILEIKQRRIADPRRRANVQLELTLLTQVLQRSGCSIDATQFQALQRVNAVLWELENRIRHLEQAQSLGDEYLAVARDIHRNNDVRHQLKRGISVSAASPLIEEKEYSTDS